MSQKGGGRPSLVISAASNWAVLIVNAILGIVMTPLIIRHIGKDGFGIWALVSSLVCYYGLLRLGVGTAIMRYISLNDGRGDRDAVNGTFSTAMIIYTAVGLLVVVISFLYADTVARFFKQDRDFVQLVQMLGIATALSCPCSVVEAAMRSREKFVFTNTVMLMLSVFRYAGLALVLYLGYGLLAMAVVTMCLSIIDMLIMWIAFRISCPDIRFKLSSVHVDHFKYLFSFGAMVTLVTIGTMLRFNSDRVVVGKILTLDELGIYSVAASLLVYFRNIMRATTRALNPRFSFLDGRGNLTDSVGLFIKSSKMTAILASAASLLLMLSGPRFLRLWVGTGFESAYIVLIILAAAHMVGQSQTATAAMLNGFGKQGALAAYTILEGLSSIGLSIYLGQKYGLTGIAVGISIPMLIFQGVLLPIYAAQYLKIHFWNFYVNCFVFPWLLAIGIFTGANLFIPLENITTWPRLVLFSSMVALFYCLVCYQFALTASERDGVIRRIMPFLLRGLAFEKKP